MRTKMQSIVDPTYSSQQRADFLLSGWRAAQLPKSDLDYSQPIAWQEGFNLYSARFGGPQHDLSAYEFPTGRS